VLFFPRGVLGMLHRTSPSPGDGKTAK
jgi:hypothetical protein